MNGFLLKIGGFEPLARGASAIDRWSGMRSFTSGSDGGMSWVWWIIIAVVLLAVIILAYLLIKRMSGRRATPGGDEFRRRGIELGLREQELKLLKHITRLLVLKNPASIYTSQSVFRDGIDLLMRSEKVTAMTDRMRAGTSALLESIREKLGFQRPFDDGSEVAVNSRQVAAGAKVYITTPDNFESVEAVVVETGPSEFELEADVPPPAKAGDVWVIRHPVGQSLWEFDATVVRTDEGKVVLGHSHRIRMINLRRFPRVATNKPAQVAMFPFTEQNPILEAPEFVPATVVEIGGAGLLVEMPMQTEVDEKVILVVKIDNERLIQGTGKVRRVFKDKQGNRMVAMELVGLNSNELAELICETNLVAILEAQEKAEAIESEAPA